MALLSLKTGRFAEAAARFAAIAREEPDNVLAHYYAGISAFKHDRFAEAVDFLNRAGGLSDSIKANAQYYAGICYQKMGQLDQAVAALTYARENAESESLREYAAQWLSAIEKEKKTLKPYDLYLKVGYQYDDNVQLEPLDEDIYADEEDSALVAHFLGRYNFVNRQDVKIGVGYSHYQSWYADLDEFDLVGSTGELYAKYRRHPLTFGISYLPSYYWVDSDSYLRQHRFRPEVAWQISSKLIGRVSYSYSDKNNFEEPGRDADNHDGALDIYYTILPGKVRLFGGAGYESNHATHPDYDYGQWNARLGLALQLPWRLEATLAGRYHDKRYDNTDSVFGVEREDDKVIASAALARPVFFDWLRLSADFSHTRNDSNIDDYEYERNVGTLALIVRY